MQNTNPIHQEAQPVPEDAIPTRDDNNDQAKLWLNKEEYQRLSQDVNEKTTDNYSKSANQRHSSLVVLAFIGGFLILLNFILPNLFPNNQGPAMLTRLLLVIFFIIAIVIGIKHIVSRAKRNKENGAESALQKSSTKLKVILFVLLGILLIPAAPFFLFILFFIFFFIFTGSTNTSGT